MINQSIKHYFCKAIKNTVPYMVLTNWSNNVRNFDYVDIFDDEIYIYKDCNKMIVAKDNLSFTDYYNILKLENISFKMNSLYNTIL